jgi:hypothetical protein
MEATDKLHAPLAPLPGKWRLVLTEREVGRVQDPTGRLRGEKISCPYREIEPLFLGLQPRILVTISTKLSHLKQWPDKILQRKLTNISDLKFLKYCCNRLYNVMSYNLVDRRRNFGVRTSGSFLLPRRRRQYTPLKRWCLSSKLYVTMFQKTSLLQAVP